MGNPIYLIHILVNMLCKLHKRNTQERRTRPKNKPVYQYLPVQFKKRKNRVIITKI